MTTSDQNRNEDVARAMYGEAMPGRDWMRCPEDVRQHWRRYARVALGAAFAALTTPQDGGDALEARQPTEGDREALAKVLFAAENTRDWVGWELLTDVAREAYLEVAEIVLDAGFSRAAVPDAATEEAQRQAARADANLREWDVASERADKAETERDAALAAIERVQETLSLHNPNGRLVKEVLAALDGAPEPDDDPCKAETHSWSHYRPEQIDSYWIRCTLIGKHDEHEDSHTGLKWRSGLPVEGESSGE